MSVHTLIDLLEQLDTVHLHMLDLAAEKKKVIIANEVESLIKIMNQEAKLVKQIEILEQKRAASAQQYLRERGIKSELNLNLTELSRLVFDVEEKKRLLAIQEKLSETLQKLKRANELNQKLIEQSLSFIDLSLDILVGRPNQDVTYHHPADRSGNVTRSGLFDSRA